MKRDELRRQARLLIIGCPGCTEDACIYCLVPGVDDTLNQLMKLIDEYTDAVLQNPRLTGRELWTCKDMAENLGLLDATVARVTASRLKVQAVAAVKHPVTGRLLALYPADEARTKYAARKEETPR